MILVKLCEQDEQELDEMLVTQATGIRVIVLTDAEGVLDAENWSAHFPSALFSRARGKSKCRVLWIPLTPATPSCCLGYTPLTLVAVSSPLRQPLYRFGPSPSFTTARTQQHATSRSPEPSIPDTYV